MFYYHFSKILFVSQAFSSDEEDCDDIGEERFESKVDYERFLGLLRESLNKSGGGNKVNTGGMLDSINF